MKLISIKVPRRIGGFYVIIICKGISDVARNIERKAMHSKASRLSTFNKEKYMMKYRLHILPSVIIHSHSRGRSSHAKNIDKHAAHSLKASRDNTNPLSPKEGCIVFWFCILLVIIGIALAWVTRNQWWLSLLLGPFLILVAKRGDKK